MPATTTAPPGVLLPETVAHVLTEERRKRFDAHCQGDAVHCGGDDATCPRRDGKHCKPDGTGTYCKPLTASTVMNYVKQSRIVGGRYLETPMPQPNYLYPATKKGPWWPAADEQKIRTWYRTLPSQAHTNRGNVRRRRRRDATTAG